MPTLRSCPRASRSVASGLKEPPVPSVQAALPCDGRQSRISPTLLRSQRDGSLPQIGKPFWVSYSISDKKLDFVYFGGSILTFLIKGFEIYHFNKSLVYRREE